MMRREIETAIKTKRNIVALMLEGFSFGTPAIANQLTGTLAPITKYKALSVPNEYFLEAMETPAHQVSQCAAYRSDSPAIRLSPTGCNGAEDRG